MLLEAVWICRWSAWPLVFVKIRAIRLEKRLLILTFWLRSSMDSWSFSASSNTGGSPGEAVSLKRCVFFYMVEYIVSIWPSSFSRNWCYQTICSKYNFSTAHLNIATKYLLRFCPPHESQHNVTRFVFYLPQRTCISTIEDFMFLRMSSSTVVLLLRAFWYSSVVISCISPLCFLVNKPAAHMVALMGFEYSFDSTSSLSSSSTIQEEDWSTHPSFSYCHNFLISASVKGYAFFFLLPIFHMFKFHYLICSK